MENLEVLVQMKLNWGMIGVIILNTIIWYSIFTNGILVTLLWIVICVCSLTIIIKLRDMRI